MTNKTEYQRAYRERNRAKFREYSRSYRQRMARHPRTRKLMRARSRQWQAKWRTGQEAVRRIVQRMYQRGRPVTHAEARELLLEYGPDYPLTRGLSAEQKRWLRRQKDGAHYRGVEPEDHVVLVFEAWEWRPEAGW